MIYLYLFALLWALFLWLLLTYRTAENAAWNMLDGAIIALVVTTAVAEYQWWLGLGQTIWEYIRA